MAKEAKPKAEKKRSIHYVNNKEFSTAVVDYVRSANEAKDIGQEAPIIPDYIGDCFMKIAEGYSHKPNFIRYSYRDEMVMDAVENCVKAIMNFDLNKATRTGLPNAFAYFTQISYFAFLRRIAKEKKQWEIKLRFIESASIDSFADFGMDGISGGDSLIEKIRGRTDSISHRDDSFLEPDPTAPKKAIKRGWPARKPKAKLASTTASLFDED